MSDYDVVLLARERQNDQRKSTTSTTSMIAKLDSHSSKHDNNGNNTVCTTTSSSCSNNVDNINRTHFNESTSTGSSIHVEQNHHDNQTNRNENNNNNNSLLVDDDDNEERESESSNNGIDDNSDDDPIIRSRREHRMVQNSNNKKTQGITTKNHFTNTNVHDCITEQDTNDKNYKKSTMVTKRYSQYRKIKISKQQSSSVSTNDNLVTLLSFNSLSQPLSEPKTTRQRVLPTKQTKTNNVGEFSSSSASSSSSSSPLMLSPIIEPKDKKGASCSWWQKSAIRKTVSFLEQDIQQVLSESSFLQQCYPNKTNYQTSLTTKTEISNNSNNKLLLQHYDNEEETTTIPLFQRSEIITGPLVGQGGFANVYEIIDMQLDERVSSNVSDHVQQLRIQTASQVIDPITGRGRYVIKQLQQRLLDHATKQQQQHQQPKKNNNKTKKDNKTTRNSIREFELAASDLVIEVLFLSQFQHKNILAVRGKPYRGIYAFLDGRYDSYFMICDRLSDTLEDRIHTKWKHRHNTDTTNASNYNNNYNTNTTNIPDIVTKTWYASQLADAIHYLHERRIIFRDLKPPNIGFSINDPHHVVLFDFGLCREIPSPALPKTADTTICTGDNNDNSSTLPTRVALNDENLLYDMSNVGTRRYMAPEIVNDSRYNLKADVYSLSMVFYEMLTHKKPFSSYSIEDHRITVCQGGERPSLTQTKIPSCIRTVLKRSWNESVSNRISIDVVCSALQWILSEWKHPQSCTFYPPIDESASSLSVSSLALQRSNNDTTTPSAGGTHLHHHQNEQYSLSQPHHCSSRSLSPPPILVQTKSATFQRNPSYARPVYYDPTPPSPCDVRMYSPDAMVVLDSSIKYSINNYSKEEEVVQKSSTLLCFSNSSETKKMYTFESSPVLNEYTNKYKDHNSRTNESQNPNIFDSTNGNGQVVTAVSQNKTDKHGSKNYCNNSCGTDDNYVGCFPDIMMDLNDYGVDVVFSLKSLWGK